MKNRDMLLFRGWTLAYIRDVVSAAKK
jgi:hypothetical protein